MEKWFERGKTRILSIHIHYSSFAHSLRVTCKFVKAKQEETSGEKIFARSREMRESRQTFKHAESTPVNTEHKHCDGKLKACDRLDLEGDEGKPLFSGAFEMNTAARPSQRTILHISTFVISKQALPVCSEHENRPTKERRMRSISSDERDRGPALRK